MRSKKYVIGTGALLEWAVASWAEAEPGLELHAVDLGQDADHRFDLSPLDAVSADDSTAFVVWSDQFLNFRRLELMGEIKARGLRMPALVCKHAMVAATAKLGENVAVGSGAVVGTHCHIGFNSFVGAGVLLGHHVKLGQSVWLADGVQIGATSEVGAQTTLGQGVNLAEGMRVGKQCVVRQPGRYDRAISSKSFLLPGFHQSVVVLDNS